MKRTILSSLAAVICAVAVAQTPKIVAHRGYWKAANGAQNSIEAFNKADSTGAYASEFDVWFLPDDSLVINHDRRFKGLDMHTSTYKEVRAVSLDNGERIPTLDEFLLNAVNHPDIRLVLELKPLPDMCREDLAALIIVDRLKKYRLMERTDIISFSINACLAFVKESDGALPVYYLDGDLAPKKIKALGLAGIDYHGSVLDKNPQWITQAHDLGLKVNVWTIDSDSDKQRHAGAGVDFITTNNP